MKPKMSKQYINYEEPVFERRQRKNDLRGQEQPRDWLYIVDSIFTSLMGVCLRTLAYFVFLTMFLLLVNTNSIVLITLGIIYGYFLLIGTYKWIDNRITIWRIDYYIKRRQFRKIWTTPSLCQFLLMFRRAFVFEIPEIIFDYSYENGYRAGEGPDNEIAWRDDKINREFNFITIRFLSGFFWIGEHNDKYASEYIFEILWNSTYLVIFGLIVWIDFKLAMRLEDFWQVLLSCYMGLQFVFTGKRLGSRLLNYARYKIKNRIIYTIEGRRQFSSIEEWFFSMPIYGAPAGHYNYRAFKKPAHIRFFNNLLRTFTLI